MDVHALPGQTLDTCPHTPSSRLLALVHHLHTHKLGIEHAPAPACITCTRAKRLLFVEMRPGNGNRSPGARYGNGNHLRVAESGITCNHMQQLTAHTTKPGQSVHQHSDAAHQNLDCRTYTVCCTLPQHPTNTGLNRTAARAVGTHPLLPQPAAAALWESPRGGWPAAGRGPLRGQPAPPRARQRR